MDGGPGSVLGGEFVYATVAVGVVAGRCAVKVAMTILQENIRGSAIRRAMKAGQDFFRPAGALWGQLVHDAAADRVSGQTALIISAISGVAIEISSGIER